MSPYAREVADMIQRVGGQELLDRLRDADLPSMLRASGTAARRRVTSFEELLVEAHRSELALIFAEAGRRALISDGRFVLHERGCISDRHRHRAGETWRDRASDELTVTEKYSARHYPLLRQCLESSLRQPEPSALFGAAMRLHPTDIIRVAVGIDLRRRSRLEQAAMILGRVAKDGSSTSARSLSSHSLGAIQVQLGQFQEALDSFRDASVRGVEPAPIHAAYWAALAFVVEDRDGLLAADRALQCADESLVAEAIDGFGRLAKISAWPRVSGRRRHASDSLGPATRRICHGIA